MCRWLIVIAVLLVPVGGYIGWSQYESSKARMQAREFQAFMEDLYSDQPQRGLPYDWVDCLESFDFAENADVQRFECDSWTAQGVTSTLIALRFGDDLVPVVESRIADDAGNDPPATSRIALHITGGPGDPPFYSNRALTKVFIERLREDGTTELLGTTMPEMPHYQLMQRGFTIASVGYWGSNIRTLNAADEFELGARDVRLAIDHYRDASGAEPVIVTESLGNHIALAALGKDRLQRSLILSLVPVMDGLQHHLVRSQKEMEQDLAKGKPYGHWKVFNIYTRSEDAVQFDHSEGLSMPDYVPRYIGVADYSWGDVALNDACSKIVLGSKDPRTLDYLERSDTFAPFVEILDADHDVYRDQPERLRAIFAEFAECVIAGEG